MSNVKSLPNAVLSGDPVPEVVEQLESLLARAKAGDIREIAIAATTGQKCVVTAWHHDGDYYRLVGAVSWLHARLVAE